MSGSKMIERHCAALRAMKGRSVAAGWFESARYPAEPGSNVGIAVARIARLMNYGGTIDHPGGTRYIRDAVVGGRFVGTRFVKKDFVGETEVTQPHKITIPARPFMRLAFEMFKQQRGELQKKLAKKLADGTITADQALAQFGLALEGAIAKSIKNGPWEPNSPGTARKKGFNKPLIDSSHMLQSISSKVT